MYTAMKMEAGGLSTERNLIFYRSWDVTGIAAVSGAQIMWNDVEHVT